jgi:hypothetical protein
MADASREAALYFTMQRSNECATHAAQSIYSNTSPWWGKIGTLFAPITKLDTRCQGISGVWSGQAAARDTWGNNFIGNMPATRPKR